MSKSILLENIFLPIWRNYCYRTVLIGTFYTTKDINVYHQYFIYIMAIRLLVEKTEVLRENYQVADKLYQIKLYQVHLDTGSNQTHDISGDMQLLIA